MGPPDGVGHNIKPSPVHPQLRQDYGQKPPSEIDDDDDEEKRRLRTLDGNYDWEKESALARERLFREMGPDQDDETNEELIVLEKRIFWTLIHYNTGDEESRKQLLMRDPNIINDIERYKKLHRMKRTSRKSHSPGSPDHSSRENGSGGRVDNSIQDSPTHGRSAQLPPGSSPHHHVGETENGGSSHPPSTIHPPPGAYSGSPPGPPRSQSGGIDKSASGNDRSGESSD
ncbi:uncharacterized protein LOC135844523 isoform X2 [Planococcus citri]|uniref:uncharacterized protein LOC135844523 isoform X2 n=1 Tax=Planococcus citri TaxID=170843 RepID=UPI0031F895A3